MHLRLLSQLIINLLNVYQQYISNNLPRSCRFYPSCSEYAKQAIVKYGLFQGAGIAIRRLACCHSFSDKQGFDPLR